MLFAKMFELLKDAFLNKMSKQNHHFERKCIFTSPHM